ncbi:Transcriptional regulator containing GAF, AAA-type ATPase, and DNA-binding Fis domains [Desulfatibacillum alkenivorans DSM 16219]|jgi:transcriptional regulator with GAF, ATPase, and Fis domain|uniref:Transcriptional regulator containing GAF, AAA-type ATPase, and DNA-binding Fis domains n=1 Tax=Desulfatibacillum alkenivorans DSM 16219 TaxID=1121393 RepID=A0A1M6R967_9BACT|nr:sigma 54-interacting transcriptional regulator [Desulfatibacillum alkenivorans]SHK28966.1 Transcriptional regulator containing GAF, AAA-type ATPase, and DNA-binding Fis domains [Desulfatibacillum alkenivorans DSM 16219]
MNPDPNEFFKNTVLRICSSLEVEKALWHSLLYVREHIPASQMSLHLYNPVTGIAETVAHATPGKYGRLSVKTHLSEKARRQVEAQRSQRLRRVNRVSDDPVAEEVSRYFGGAVQSALILDLVIEGRLIGVLTLHGEVGKTYTARHEQLFRLLNEPFAVALSNSMRQRELNKLKELLTDDNPYFQENEEAFSENEVVGADYGLRGVMEMARQVAPLESPVLLLGETGVGKELIASAVHRASPRRNGPLIKVNCGAIPDTLIDSELFGHEKGAFTGASSMKRGRFERADEGTIFLDEVAELSPEAQVRLLRVLQEKEIERVGATETTHVDIRVIAATHRNLDGLVSMGRFRQDLLFRLKVFPIVIPPLRDRKGDIPSLVQHFVRIKSLDMKLGTIPPLAPGAMDKLMDYSWPGNVRELENAVERALILSGGKKPVFQEFDLGLKPGPKTKNVESLSLPTMDQAMADLMRKALVLAKGRVEGKGGAAEILGIHPMTLRNRMKKLGVPFGKKARAVYKSSAPSTVLNWPQVKK